MKISILLLFISACIFTGVTASSQNVLLNVLTQNAGIVKIGKTILLEVSVCNTDALDAVPVYKLRPQLSIPGAIARIPSSGHTLPAGWTIVSNDGSTIRLSNGTDIIPAHDCRTILIAIEGKADGGPSTISGSLLFSNGVAPGSMPGAATRGDNPADNNSTTTCEIVK